MNQIRFTKQGFEKLKKEYEELKKSRQPAVEDLSKARAMGDLSENGYYKAAKQKLSSIDYQLRSLSLSLRNGVIMEEKQTDSVSIGTTVTLKNEKETVTYAIVGDLEAKPVGEKNITPLANRPGNFGKKVGDNVQIHTPSGTIHYQIVTVDSYR